MTYNSTSVSKVPEGTDNGNLTNDISKRAQITYYVEISHKLVVKHKKCIISKLSNSTVRYKSTQNSACHSLHPIKEEELNLFVEPLINFLLGNCTIFLCISCTKWKPCLHVMKNPMHYGIFVPSFTDFFLIYISLLEIKTIYELWGIVVWCMFV